MPHITFKRDYDHKWPSRAVSAYKAGWSGTVKKEVADAAVPKFARKSKPDADTDSGVDAGGSKSVADGDDSK